MTEDTSTPPSQTLTHRLRILIADLDATSVESAAKQICEWIGSFKDHDDRFRGLLRLSAELVLEKAIERPNKDFHHVLGRFCKILDTATDGESSRFLNSLWKQEIQAAGVELLENDTAEAGNWPEYISLITFAGELCDEALLQPDPLRSCANMLSGSGSNLGLELACTLFEAAGRALREDGDGRQYFDTVIQAMLTTSTGDGISARIRHRVQEVAMQWTSGPPPSDAQWDDETVNPDAGEERPARQAVSQLCKPRHPEFYFESGDIVFVCEDTSFRVHSDLLSDNPQVFLDMLEQARSNGGHLSDGCPCVHSSDAVEDFATLLRVFYTSGFPHRHKTPDFTTFSSLLRMTTKYEFREIRSQILLDLLPAYPTQFSDYKTSSCLGEAVFGPPLPHPNSVLDLFVQCKVSFALPFAYYRACVAGDPALLNTSAGETALPTDTLKAALRGQTQLKADEVQLARRLALQDCKGWRCSGKTPSSRTQVFDWILPRATTQGGILEKGDFMGSGHCDECSQTFAQGLLGAQKDTWEKLPSYFGLPTWEDHHVAPALYLYPLGDSFVPKKIPLLPQKRVTIGRQTNAETAPSKRNGHFDLKALSRKHSEVWEQDGKIYIKDVGSSNGTFINGQRLSGEGLESEPFELKSDDIVEFGVNIVGKDNKSIIHHKAAGRVVCVLNDQDAQAAAHAEQQ